MSQPVEATKIKPTPISIHDPFWTGVKLGFGILYAQCLIAIPLAVLWFLFLYNNRH